MGQKTGRSEASSSTAVFWVGDLPCGPFPFLPFVEPTFRFGELKETKRQLKTNDVAVIDLSAEIDGEEIEDAKVEAMSYLSFWATRLALALGELQSMRILPSQSSVMKRQVGSTA